MKRLSAIIFLCVAPIFMSTIASAKTTQAAAVTPAPAAAIAPVQPLAEPTLGPAWEAKRSKPRDPFERKRFVRIEADNTQSLIHLIDTDCDCSPGALASVQFTEMVQAGVPIDKISNKTESICGTDGVHVARTRMGSGPDDMTNGDWYFFQRGEKTYKLEILYHALSLTHEMRMTARLVCPV